MLLGFALVLVGADLDRPAAAGGGVAGRGGGNRGLLGLGRAGPARPWPMDTASWRRTPGRAAGRDAGMRGRGLDQMAASARRVRPAPPPRALAPGFFLDGWASARRRLEPARARRAVATSLRFRRHQLHRNGLDLDRRDRRGWSLARSPRWPHPAGARAVGGGTLSACGRRVSGRCACGDRGRRAAWSTLRRMCSSISSRMRASRLPAERPPSTTATRWRAPRRTEVTRLKPESRV